MWYVPIVFITALLLLPDYAELTTAGVYRLKLLLANISSGVAYSIVFSRLLMSMARLTAYCLRGLGFPCRGLPTLTAPCYPLRLS